MPINTIPYHGIPMKFILMVFFTVQDIILMLKLVNYIKITNGLFFLTLGTGYLDSLEIIGNPTNFGAMVRDNLGTIYACKSNLSITSAEIINPSPWIAGICMLNTHELVKLFLV